MITGNIYKKGRSIYLLWDFNTKDEERILRQLLKDTPTRVGHKIVHFTTKVDNQPLTGQQPLF